MHIGILRTDSVRPEWVPTFGEYPDMFQRLLLAEDSALTFTTWNVEAEELPDSVEAADGFLITGSKSSVYDDKDWIRALEGFVRECHALLTPHICSTKYTILCICATNMCGRWTRCLYINEAVGDTN